MLYTHIVFTFSCLLLYPHFSEQSCVATAGYYCPRSDGDPIRCAKGYYCPGAPESAMIPCPQNTFNVNDGGGPSSSCQACPLRTVTSGSGFTACNVCPAGTYYSVDVGCVTCPDGQSSVADSDTCSSCLAGHYSDSQTCSTCRPGTYQDMPGEASCKACPDGTYTYSLNTSASGASVFSALWGAVSLQQCTNLPTFGAPLVCLPGTYMRSGNCLPCPIGYYCPTMQILEADPLAVRVCSGSKLSEAKGAISQSDCSKESLLRPYVFNNCKIAEGDTQVLDDLDITASVTSKSTGTLYFTTATAVYRVMLMATSTKETLAGVQGEAALNGDVLNAVGVNAKFTSLTAIAVDYDANEATIIVVGDGSSVRMVNIFTKEVTLLGKKGDIGVVGGIALLKGADGSKKAYVSDTQRHRIMVFDMQNMQTNLVAGSLLGQVGAADSWYSSARFNSPKGLAFLEKNLNSARMLLVADSGNGKIRVVDTQTREVKTWFAPLDRTTPELTAPSEINVALITPESSSSPLVYIVDAGSVKVIQFPVASDSSVKVISSLAVAAGMSITFQNAIPYGSAVVSSNGVTGFQSLIALNAGSRKISAFVEQGSSGNSATCSLPCEKENGVCEALTIANLCGNSFLDTDATAGYEEQCDDGGADLGGCDKVQCTIKAGYTCPNPLTHCLNPCPAFTYAPDSTKHCSQDCLSLTPRPGYTIDDKCVEHDIDECIGGSALCGPQAICTNLPGSYTCNCLYTFFGDGVNCAATAFAVFTLVDLPPTYPSSIFVNALTDPKAITSKTTLDALAVLKEKYARVLSTFLPQNMLVSPGFTKNTTELAIGHTYVSVDPVFKLKTRLEIVSLFPTLEIAQEAATKTSASGALGDSLSKAFFADTSVMVVSQQPKVRKHNSLSFTQPNIIEGWGMDISSVTYNRTCVVKDVTPTGGCWEVEMIYVGGQQLPSANENPSLTIPQSKNVLYLPRIDHDPITMELTNPSQALTESSEMAFPCSTTTSSSSGLGVSREATACCFRDFSAMYRPHAGFAEFLGSAEYIQGAPSNFCDAQTVFNDTYPSSNLVYIHGGEEGETNDLVVGKLEGMPHSEVRLLETIDYTTRTFRVLLVLEEGDLRERASSMQGSLGLDYSLTFFVGLANFEGTGGSVVNTKHVQQYITVSKSNMLTISTYGANQDPLVDYSDMQLVRVKVADFFQPIRYLYYLQPLFTMPKRFSALVSSTGIVPLESIRVIKAQDNPSATDQRWMQACANEDGDYIYADTSLQQLVRTAQGASCVPNQLLMCTPPQTVSQVVTFGIPLPENFISTSDLTIQPPYALRVQFIVQAFDTVAKANVITSIAMSVDISALGMQTRCETITASQTLTDIVSGNIFIGTATNDYEWDNILMKKVNMDVPGTGPPSNSFEFETVTVQGSIMTFTALGDPAYFQDPRAVGQSVHINDIYSVNFLEPLGGKTGTSENFNRVKALFLNGSAFTVKTDDKTHNAWLQPTQELLNICPYKPSAGRMVCLTRVLSTITNNVLNRNVKDVVEIRPGEASSVAEMKGLMGEVLMQGGTNGFTNTMGTNFSNQLVTRLNLNNRYRKAYVVNPLVDWSYQAMQETQPRSTAYTVCTKIIAIGLITIQTASGTQLGRRLLSTSMDLFPTDHLAVLPTESLSSPYLHSGRALLQVSPGTSMAPTQTQSGNSLILTTDIPGYDSITHLCEIILGAPYDKCNVLQFQNQLSGQMAIDYCEAESKGTLGDILTTLFQNALQDPKGYSQIAGMFLLDFKLYGCESVPAPGQRRLLAESDVVVSIVTNYVTSNKNGTTFLLLDETNKLGILFNSSMFTRVVGGGGFVTALELTYIPAKDGGVDRVKVIVHLANTSSLNTTRIKEDLNRIVGGGDIMIFEGTYGDKSSSAFRGYFASCCLTLLINTLTVLSISTLFSGLKN